MAHLPTTFTRRRTIYYPHSNIILKRVEGERAVFFACFLCLGELSPSRKTINSASIRFEGICTACNYMAPIKQCKEAQKTYWMHKRLLVIKVTISPASTPLYCLHKRRGFSAHPFVFSCDYSQGRRLETVCCPLSTRLSWAWGALLPCTPGWCRRLRSPRRLNSLCHRQCLEVLQQITIFFYQTSFFKHQIKNRHTFQLPILLWYFKCHLLKSNK